MEDEMSFYLKVRGRRLASEKRGLNQHDMTQEKKKKTKYKESIKQTKRVICGQPTNEKNQEKRKTNDSERHDRESKTHGKNMAKAFF